MSRLNRTADRVTIAPRLCPWYFECVIVYARHECCLNGTGAEAGLLVVLLACQAILLQGTTDSLDDVRGCCHRIGGLPEKAALYFCREGCSMLFCTERAVLVSVDCYDPRVVLAS